MTKPPRMRWIGLAAVTSAGLLSGCYYYPYGYSPWGYPPYPYTAGYPYGAANPYPPAPAAAQQYPAPGERRRGRNTRNSRRWARRSR